MAQLFSISIFSLPYTILIDQDGIVRDSDKYGSRLSREVGGLLNRDQKK